MAVMVGGALFFLAGGICFLLAGRKSRTPRPNSKSATSSSRRTHRGVARDRAMATSSGSSTVHGTPAPTTRSYYAQAPPSRAKGRPMGWYSVDGSLSDERFWDGSAWTARRQLVEGTWAPVPLAG